MNNPRLESLPLRQIKIDDLFWNRYTRLIPEVVLPYQWEILNDNVPDAPPSYAIQNLKLLAGEAKGTRQGAVFQDSDVAKWLEAVAYSLETSPDPVLEQRADEVIALIGRAQSSDGYLNSYYTLLEGDNRWSNLTEGHELYCAGHFIEAAVAYYQATGKTAFLEIIRNFADLICKVFGDQPGQNNRGCPGHQEIELALVKLYRVTGERKYLDTAKHFLDVRGASPNYFIEEMARPDYKYVHPEFKGYLPLYSQSHLPVREQTTAEGHSVRALYMYASMADVAYETKDEELLKQCEILWNNVVDKRMYVTGSVGSSGFWERFTTDYDLPNESNYSETCASIALAMFGQRMHQITRDSRYIDIVEKALYNTVRAGISFSGDRYFYVNPLEVWPDNCLPKTSMNHVKPVRQKWFDVACCPTNVARTFTSLGQYLYGIEGESLYVNLYMANQTNFTIDDTPISLEQTTAFPKEGQIFLSIQAETPKEMELCFRVPEYSEDFSLLLNGNLVQGELEKGYLCLRRTWSNDTLQISFEMKPRFLYASPNVRANIGRVALQRGPEIYCLEEMDNQKNLASIMVNPESPITQRWEPDLLGGTLTLEFDAHIQPEVANSPSYAPEKMGHLQPIRAKAIPYGSWGNRTPGEMIVWIREDFSPH